MGHIATDPKCPQHPTKMGRTRFNAQRLIEDETEGDEEAQQEYVEDPEDLQDGNSWGGSQYEPEGDFDEGEDNMVHDEPSDNGGSNNIGSSTHNNISSGNEEPPIPDIKDIVP